jgi:hypothetical protein
LGEKQTKQTINKGQHGHKTFKIIFSKEVCSIKIDRRIDFENIQREINLVCD